MSQKDQLWSSGILFFDGVCGLCDHFVTFLFRHDHKRRLRFAPLQGKTAKEQLPADIRQQVDSVIFKVGSRTLTRSQAAIEALAALGGAWQLTRLLLLIPRPLRDAVYDGVARHRYRIFGRKDTCRLPSPVERGFFLD